MLWLLLRAHDHGRVVNCADKVFQFRNGFFAVASVLIAFQHFLNDMPFHSGYSSVGPSFQSKRPAVLLERSSSYPKFCSSLVNRHAEKRCQV